MEARLQRYVRYELSKVNEASGLETFEEFDNFELEEDDEDLDITSGYELTEMQEEMPRWNEAEQVAQAEAYAEDVNFSGDEQRAEPDLGPQGPEAGGETGGGNGNPEGDPSGGTEPPKGGEKSTLALT